MDFTNLEMLLTDGVEKVEIHLCAKFRRNRPIYCRDIALFYLFKMAATRHLEFVVRVFGPPTKGIWWSLSLYKICWNRCSSFDNM